MNALVEFMNGPVGRLLRIGLGAALIVVGVVVVGGPAGWVIAAVGLVPIALAASGHCMLEIVAGRAGPRAQP